MVFKYEQDIGDFKGWGNGQKNLEKVIDAGHYTEMVDDALKRFPDGVYEDVFNDYLEFTVPAKHPEWLEKKENANDTDHTEERHEP